MPIIYTAEKAISVGQPTVIHGAAPQGTYAVVFEDNGETGYFYAVDASKQDQTIRDSLHIYDVAGVTDRNQPSVIEIGWAKDNQKAVLLINGYPHAIFDFAAKQGYCRTGFPEPAAGSEWGSEGHAWRESAVELFA